jgi:hypothetical protein
VQQNIPRGPIPGFHPAATYTATKISIIKKNAEALLDASKENGLEVKSEETKYWVKQKVFAFFK